MLRYILLIQQLFGFRTSHDINTRMIILGEDSLRSQYVPPKPMVKILKRPTGDSRGSGDGPLNDDKPKQPIKTLKQVYNCIVRFISINLRSIKYMYDVSYIPHDNLFQREQEYAEARRRILGEEKSPEERTMQEINRIQAKSNGNNYPSNVVRMPAGPDGTRGFNVRR